jgi:signal transduction histidine kinase
MSIFASPIPAIGRNAARPLRKEARDGALRPLLSRFIETMPVPIVLLRGDGTIVDVNSAFLEEFPHGRTCKSDWAGRPFLSCIGESTPPLDAPLTAVLSGKTANVRKALISFGDTGIPVFVNLHGAPMSGESGGRETALLVLSNVSGQDHLERQLAQAQKMEAIGRLAGGVAHDFNNLLTGILGYASLLKASLPSCSEEADAASCIERAARKAAELTRHLLAYSRREAAISRPLDANRVIHESIEILSRSVNKNVRIATRLLAADSTILGDPTALTQSLLNLGVNANDAMPSGGELGFATENLSSDGTLHVRGIPIPKGGYLVLRVTDTGTGIPEEIREKVFEPFFTTKEPGRGTGLGLSMVYGCVKSHNGFIFLHSKAGAGSAFEILLPLSDRTEEQVEGAASAPRVFHGTETVLVVDDEEIPLRLACDMLRTLGYKPLPASTGEEGLHILRKNPEAVDAVILDNIMPGMDGGETLRRIREIRPGARVILSSGYAYRATAAPEELQEFDGVLPKPYEMDKLAAILRSVLDGE